MIFDPLLNSWFAKSGLALVPGESIPKMIPTSIGSQIHRGFFGNSDTLGRNRISYYLSNGKWNWSKDSGVE